ncbi:phosphate ABC transporter substrate-binding protein, PhoT family [Frankia torreyi]|uniref:Phosphate ABC transporter substrate-binding protein, PhoT family n=1 Tax=Frankia torreyi TaxID=1856 RepID=A0A0D8BKF2_9ACTN|nr:MULTISPECIES: Hsp70 family protein [Frankia]KJE23872.1 phosphate ABC transporter substrate-binding protein, PhoT family [Frankia torreyi]KQC40070.1 molecular chaperone DnaK [Frankia sp. ACN1ag]
MSYQLGIDVGSANTIVAVTDGGWPRVLELGGQRRLPSVVFAPPGGGLQFARAAARRAQADPARSATDLLRRLGDGGPILLGGAAYSREGLLGRLVAHLVGLAVDQLGGLPDQVVVTFPTFWSPGRRETFTDAITQLSGLELPVVALPAADAMGTLLARSSVTQTVDLVGWYDLGAGFLDAAVLSFSPFGFQLVGAPAGLRHGAGLDLDELLVDRVLAVAGIAPAHLDRADAATRVALARLRREAAQAKEVLAEEDEVDLAVELPGIDASVTLTRGELETLAGPTVDDTVETFRRALRSVPADPADLSRILMSGGVAHLPLVARRLRAAFPEIGRIEHRADADVAMGAALIAADLADRSARAGGAVFGAVGAAGAGAIEEPYDVTAVIRPPDASSLTSLPPFLSGGGTPPPGAGAGGAAGEGGAAVAAGSSDGGTPGPYGAAGGSPGFGEATVLTPDAGRGHGAAGLPGGGGGGALGQPGAAPGAYAAAASADETGLLPADAAGAPVGAAADAGGSHRATQGGGGGIFGSRRVMVAAAIIAVLFVAIGTTAGVVLTGRDSGSGGDSVAAVGGAFPTTDPIPPSSSPTSEPPAATNLVRVAGSSEVAPITETAYNEFRQTQRNVTVNIEATSTEDGFAALCSGKAELADASFELTPGIVKDPGCAKQVVGFEVAHHTLPIVVNPQNTWLHCLSLKQVKQIWGADSSVTRWSQIDSSFPDEPIAFVGPPHDSVQAEVFNATISDASDRSRAYRQVDLSGVANDVAGDRSAIGFLDYPTYETFGARLRGVEINNGEGCVAPTAVAVGTGLYLPLCKPLFVYARTDALRRPATAAFLRYFLENGRKIAFDAHYVPRSDDTVGENVARLEKLTTGVGPVPA